MTIKELIAGIEVEREAAEMRETKARKEIEIILASAQQEGRSGLSDEEDARCEQLFEIIELAKSQQDGIKSKLARARKVEAEEADSEARLAETHAVKRTAKPAYDEVARVGREERTYNPESDPRGTQFLRDVARQFMYNDVQATGRLSRHMQEARVELAGTGYLERTGTGIAATAMSGLVVPQYLVDMVAPAVANMRPFADICNKHPLPADGMSVNIPRVTTASSAALQTELAAVSWTADMASTMLTVNIQTAAGEQMLSRQAIDRGSGIEDIVLQDLFARYNTALDSTLITAASTGLDAVATAVNPGALDTTTLAATYPAILQSAAAVEGALLGYGQPTHAIMHSRRWYWFASILDSKWPTINALGVAEPQQAGQADPATMYGSGRRGVLPMGLNVIVDNNVTVTSQADAIYVVPARECHLWEDAGAPVMIRAEQPYAANLGVMLVVYGYFAYTFGRYTGAIRSVKGANLALPAGW